MKPIERKREPELIILRGLPGSAKSTRANKDYPNHLHYEPDHLFCDTRGTYRFDYQLFDKAKEFTRHMVDFALARGEDVVVSDVFPKLEELKPYFDLAEAHNAVVRVIDCTESFGNNHRVPVMVLKRMQDEFELYQHDALHSPAIFSGAEFSIELSADGQVLPEFLKRQAD